MYHYTRHTPVQQFKVEQIKGDISETDFFQNAIQGKTFATSVVPSKVPLTNEFGDVEIGLPTMFVAAPLMDEVKKPEKRQGDEN